MVSPEIHIPRKQKSSQVPFFYFSKPTSALTIISIFAGAMMPLFGFLLSDIFDSLGSATEAPTTETAAAPVVDPASIDSKSQYRFK